MAEVFDFAKEKSTRRPVEQLEGQPKSPDGKLAHYMAAPQEIKDEIDSGPPLNIPKPLDQLSTQEFRRLNTVNFLAERLVGLGYMEDSTRWSDDEVEAEKQELSDRLKGLSEAERDEILRLVIEIEEFEDRLLGIEKGGQ